MAKLNRKAKISLWIVGSVIVIGGLAYFAIFTFSARATSSFRAQAADQINTAVAGENIDATVELQNIVFGRMLNPDYKLVADLQTDYEKLLTSVKNYVAISKAHDALVEKYNAGIKGNAPLSGDLLNTVDSYLSAMKNRFPDETNRIAALENLSAKISENTNFDAVSSDIDQLLGSNNTWLGEMRKKLNQNISDFQEKVNK